MSTVRELGAAAKAASVEVAQLGTERKNAAIRAIAQAVVDQADRILEANREDIARAKEIRSAR